ncbi:MAG: hydroxyethylthiazole kinase [Rhodobiaceae bacterium]|nr:hydroxyethylthiazole kinase [Rhodobiaceae bacterium]
MPAEDLALEAAQALERLRERAPRIHCVTNAAAQVMTANGLLALGAIPSLTVNPREIADFVSGADALLINLGTLDADRISAIDTAMEIASEERTASVLDPVFIDVSEVRRDFARTLVAREPEVIRLNARELAALAGSETPDVNLCALEWLTTLAVTGETDWVADGSSRVAIGNGHPLMAQVTAMGCLASAVIAAFLPVTRSPLVAAIAGLGAMGIAGELAGGKAAGPGSFAVSFIDALAGLTPAMLRSRLEITDEAV